MSDLINKIVEIEWNEILKIIPTNEKEDTFKIMRKSQFELWSEELLKNYLQDLLAAEDRGWNLITEKYARILKYTDMVSYQKIEHMIPQVPEETEEIIDMVVALQDEWMKLFEKHYPRLANAAKSIDVYENEENKATYKQVLKSELMTYSANTIYLYTTMIINFKKTNQNYIQKMMEITCKYYNYVMIDEAERNLAN